MTAVDKTDKLRFMPRQWVVDTGATYHEVCVDGCGPGAASRQEAAKVSMRVDIAVGETVANKVLPVISDKLAM